MRHKVLFVIPTMDRCGAEKQLTLLATGLPKDKFDVKVALLTRGGPYMQRLLDAGISVELIGKNGRFSFRAYRKLKGVIKRYKPDVVHTWLFAANAYGRLAAFACKVPVVICGERCVDLWKGFSHWCVDKYLEPRTDVYAVNSQGVVDFYIQRGIPAEKFVVIPNAVELPRDDSRNPSFPWIIGLVARLWPQKRIRDALWAADQLKFSLLPFYLFIIGDGPEKESLLRFRDDLQLNDRVFFLGERDDVSRLIPCFDLLWNCSEYEGQSNSILEALSFGVPVIASDIPGNRELITSGENGLLISDFDGDETRRKTALSRETIRLLRPENHDLLKSWGEAGKTRIKRDFSVEKMIESHVELYERLLSEKQSF